MPGENVTPRRFVDGLRVHLGRCAVAILNTVRGRATLPSDAWLLQLLVLITSALFFYFIIQLWR